MFRSSVTSCELERSFIRKKTIGGFAGRRRYVHIEIPLPCRNFEGCRLFRERQKQLDEFARFAAQCDFGMIRLQCLANLGI